MAQSYQPARQHVAAARPTVSYTKRGPSPGPLPVNVSLKQRAKVTAGSAKMLAVNK